MSTRKVFEITNFEHQQYDYRINSTHIFLAGGFAGPATLCGIETQQEEIDYYGGYEDYDYQYQPGDYQPIDLQPNDDYQPSDNSTSKRAAENDYDDNNPEKVGEDQSILLTSNCDDPEVAPNIYTGGLVSNKAFMYNGLAWEELPPMSVRRDTPMCSLIQKEDRVCIFLGITSIECYQN